MRAKTIIGGFSRSLVSYGAGARTLAALWTQPWAQASACARMRRKQRRGEWQEHPFYARGFGDRATLRRHFNCNYYQRWRSDAFDRCSEPTLRRWTSIAGRDHYEKAASEGKGVLLLGAHYGAEYLLPVLLRRHGFAIVSMASNRAGRPVEFIRIAHDDSMLLKPLIEARKLLSAGRTLLVLNDQGYGRNQIAIDFLGRRRKWPQGFASLALTTGAPALPVFSMIEPDGRVVIQFGEPLERGDPERPRSQRIEALVRQYVQILEAKWREDPAALRYYRIWRQLGRKLAAGVTAEEADAWLSSPPTG